MGRGIAAEHAGAARQVATSTASLAAMVGLLVGLGAKFGAGFVFATWVMPYLVFVAWLDLVTYLHHTDKDLPWYRDPEWTYLRGGLPPTDRDYGILNKVRAQLALLRTNPAAHKTRLPPARRAAGFPRGLYASRTPAPHEAVPANTGPPAPSCKAKIERC